MSTAHLLQAETWFVCSAAMQNMLQARFYEDSPSAASRNTVYLQCCYAEHVASTLSTFAQVLLCSPC